MQTILASLAVKVAELALAITTLSAQAQTILPAQVAAPLDRKQEIRALIVDRAEYYGVSVDLSLFIAEKESRFDEFVCNPTSGACGVYQYLASTWRSHCEGIRKNRFDNVECFAKMMSEPKNISHWTADLNMRVWLYDAGFIDSNGRLRNQYANAAGNR